VNKLSSRYKRGKKLKKREKIKEYGRFSDILNS